MNTPVEIKEIASKRLEEAKVLHRNKLFDGAFYLAGYSVELMLKAKICENWGITNLFNFDEKDFGSKKHNENISIIRRFVGTHSLTILLIISGLKLKFDNEKANNKILLKANSLIIEKWSEQVRYLPNGNSNPNEVKYLIDLLKHKKGLLKWIEIN
jgi:HEPN domain